MQVGILSGGTGWHVRDLQRAATLRGDSCHVLDFRHLANGWGRARLEPFEPLDAIIVRTMPPGSLEQVVVRMDMLHVAESLGIPVLNPARSLEICIDKYLACIRMLHHGLRVPSTLVAQRSDEAMIAFEQLGSDVIVKPLFGSEGRGMMRISDPDLAWRTFRAIERTQSILYLQEFIPNPGWDLRIFLIGETVVGAMRRYARAGWRTNVAQGGEPIAVVPEPEAVELAKQAAQAVGTWVAGVDLLPDGQGGWYLLEVNAVPGWRALAPTCGVDVASAILAELHQRLGKCP
ncbi:ATP-grasp domain-containing protein [Tuwongella immobilis]|uniref:ATP-grasp domain-containing protein n=1 Tax=Tuwongella immobilis TaxID=692036 RepID=A0A6C2YQV6_9BACT|nr:RimK family alpha-L-glutamate ligase [Tuwongella immobilis]VIP03375.1 alpha-l-glutamate ligase : Alpha-L-glutamate ligase, RimK family OS=Singulisphaera acidiphila (strain ATCC BAA-1392 / DSM 18658 / VKM B-2454 / MOB10) GN=Sinac_1235 PE=4 SV=1: RimK [Tuwongella immobilis]VTS04122.1 alpha-l-glutamate ligase : Alpha-L-glutamate ligase, RimK family OS=Singulisphaera acidiphila (strain ATCC BAA-1392 / DSM 18658 / VKM B-2454 / MOB10) GN=Sinac_1235 PE=4 SV=1: RimK [Tuwongella immobilis]